MTMEYYQKHVFFCCNQRDEGKKCCNNANAEEIAAYTKEKLNEKSLVGKGRIRISRSACMGRCAEGPVLVVYPKQTWYRYKNQADIDEIIEKDLENGGVVKRLLIDN